MHPSSCFVLWVCLFTLFFRFISWSSNSSEMASQNIIRQSWNMCVTDSWLSRQSENSSPAAKGRPSARQPWILPLFRCEWKSPTRKWLYCRRLLALSYSEHQMSDSNSLLSKKELPPSMITSFFEKCIRCNQDKGMPLFSEGNLFESHTSLLYTSQPASHPVSHVQWRIHSRTIHSFHFALDARNQTPICNAERAHPVQLCHPYQWERPMYKAQRRPCYICANGIVSLLRPLGTGFALHKPS